MICICGDVNARCGMNQDFIEGADEIVERQIIDATQNYYGDLFIDHLITSNMFMLNGRVGASPGNDFTHISGRGKSVVDYAWVPHDQLLYWDNVKVHPLSN